MTGALARFAESPSGKLYDGLAQRYGFDPGAGFDDDVIGYNLRAALALAQTAEEPEPSFEEKFA